jgi:hypothetical protein
MSPATAEECLKRQSVVYAGAQKASIFLCVVRDVLVFQAAVRGGVDDVVVVVEAEPAGALREAATRRCRGCDVLLAEHVAFDGAAAADRLIEKPARTVAE